jgi:hypothetical protein
VDKKLGLNETNNVAVMLPLDPRATIIDWRNSEPVSLQERDLSAQPPANALFAGGVPSSVSAARAFTGLQNDLEYYLYRTQAFTILSNPTVKLVAEPGENERDFRARCQQAAREARDEAIDEIREKYETKIKRLMDQKAKEEDELAEDKSQLQGRVGEEILTGLDTVAGLFGLFGTRRRRSLSGVSRVASKQRLQARARADVEESVEAIKRMEADLADVQAEMQAEMSATTEVWVKAAADVQQLQVAPRKTDIDVHLVALAWAPKWEVTYQDARGLTRTDTVPAFSA